jgi:hypothetical protein
MTAVILRMTAVSFNLTAVFLELTGIITGGEQIVRRRMPALRTRS